VEINDYGTFAAIGTGRPDIHGQAVLILGQLGRRLSRVGKLGTGMTEIGRVEYPLPGVNPSGRCKAKVSFCRFPIRDSLEDAQVLVFYDTRHNTRAGSYSGRLLR
jgi:hypothetical protein